MTVKQIEGYQIYMNKMLGKGSYGSVFIGRKENNGEAVAVKILPKESSTFFTTQLTKTITSKLPSKMRLTFSKNSTLIMSWLSTT